jgi:hypothetical protein
MSQAKRKPAPGEKNNSATTNKNQTYFTLVDYSDRPDAKLYLGYEEVLQVNGVKFPIGLEFEDSQGTVHKIEKLIDSIYQRDTLAHAKSSCGTNGHFRELNTKSREIQCTFYIGPKVELEAHTIEPGTLITDDAHTRRLAMKKQYEGDAPIDKTCSIAIPTKFVYNIIVTSDPKDIERHYVAQDNKKASKSKRQQVQSALKLLNYKPLLNSDHFRLGFFASSIDVAVPTTKGSPQEIQGLDMVDQIKAIKDPMVHVDGMLQKHNPNKASDKPNVMLQHQINGVILAFLQDKAYGTQHSLLNKAIERLITNDENKNNTKDGIWHICNLFDGNNDFFEASTDGNKIVPGLREIVGNKYINFKPTLNNKVTGIEKLLPLSSGMTYYERAEGPNLLVYLIKHYIDTNGRAVIWDNVDWEKSISGKYKTLIKFAYNGLETFSL